MTFIDLGGGGEAGTQRMAGKLAAALGFGPPRTPAASAVVLTRRATSWSLSRSGPTCSPRPVTRRKSGPFASLANRIQALTAATGQVASEEPLPIPTSRRPFRQDSLFGGRRGRCHGHRGGTAVPALESGLCLQNGQHHIHVAARRL